MTIRSRRLEHVHIQTLREYRPRQRTYQSLMKAAVAMILRDGVAGTEVLMMQRAFHPKDPWSGQMAFPGGKIEPDDESSRAAAEREAFEEVGAQLHAKDYVGRLDDLYGLKVNSVFSVHVSCYVYKPERELDLVANEEVADIVWLPLGMLDDRSNAHDFAHPKEPSLNMPAVMINSDKDQVLWGLSLRMLSNFYSVLGQQMSVLSDSEHAQLQELEKRELNGAAGNNFKKQLSK